MWPLGSTTFQDENQEVVKWCQSLFAEIEKLKKLQRSTEDLCKRNQNQTTPGRHDEQGIYAIFSSCAAACALKRPLNGLRH